MRRVSLGVAGALALVLAGCGSDGGSERVEVTYEVRPAEGAGIDGSPAQADLVDRTAEILSQRLDALGEGDLRVESVDETRIAVFGEASDVDRVAASLDDPARLRIHNPAVRDVEIGNEEIVDPRAGIDPVTSRPSVQFGLTPRGRAAFRRLTGAGGTLTIELDDRVVSEAKLDPSIGPDGIDGRRGVQITGQRSLDVAEVLAAFLAIGPLPAELLQGDA